MGNGVKTAVQCEGRFNQLRDFLYNEAIHLVVGGDVESITDSNLRDIWDLGQADFTGGVYDISDPYYYSRSDELRMKPEIGYLSLVPLIEGHLELEEGLVYDYANSSMGNNKGISEKLELMTNKDPRFLKNIGKESKDISIPIQRGRVNLQGYRIASNFGIGTLSQGGVSGGGVRSDSPFLLEVHYEDRRSGSNLVSVIGFWAQNNEMLVSQMQSCKNAQYPRGIQFGVGSLRVAEAAAEKMGFEKMLVYSGENHPIFKQHPSNRKQLNGDFARIWDTSSKKLEFDGSRHTNHSKVILHD